MRAAPPAGDGALCGEPKNAAQSVTVAYLLLFSLLQPLAVRNAYFDVTEAKQACFLLLSAAYVLCVACARILSRLSARRAFPVRPVLQPLSVAQWCMLAFFGAFCLSAWLSPFAIEPWVGAANRYQGVLTVLLYAALLFCLSRNFCVHPCNEVALVAGFCAVCALAGLQAFGLDPFGLREKLALTDRPRYLSTLGNVNFYSAYLSLLLPVMLALWAFARGARRYLYGAALFCGAVGALFTGSESFLLALIPMLLLAPLLLKLHPHALRRYLLGALLLLAVMQAAYRLWLAVDADELYVSYLLQALLRAPVWGILTVLCCALWFGLERRLNLPSPGFFRRYARLLGAVCLLTIVLLLLCNTALSGVSFGAADRYLKWNAGWGTDRGRVWRFCIERFQAFAPLQKIFGGGPGCLAQLDAARNVFADASLDSAHNEFLHYLLTVGAFGLACYLALLAACCIPAARRHECDPLVSALLLGVLCYLAQSTVNIAQPVSTPWLFLCLGILAAGRADGA